MDKCKVSKFSRPCIIYEYIYLLHVSKTNIGFYACLASRFCRQDKNFTKTLSTLHTPLINIILYYLNILSKLYLIYLLSTIKSRKYRTFGLH